jgi:P27 family predicted phage terminase small subunit
LLRGNPGHRALPHGEPAPQVGLPDPPEHLPQQYKDAWPALAGQLTACGVATLLDGPSFELLVRAYVDHNAAALKVAETLGPVWFKKDADGIPYAEFNPWWTVVNKEWKKLTTMLSEFGIGPASRTRVQVNQAQEKTGVPSRKRA